VSEYIFAVLAVSVVRMRGNNVNCASSLKTAIAIDFIGYDFLSKGQNFVDLSTR